MSVPAHSTPLAKSRRPMRYSPSTGRARSPDATLIGEDTMQIEGDGTGNGSDPERHRRAFAQELLRWRQHRGLTLRELADLIPCSSTLVHQVEQAADWPAPWMLVRADWCLGADLQLVDAFVEGWLREQMERPPETAAGRAASQGPKATARHHRDERLRLEPEEAGLRVVDLCARIVAAVASWTPEMNRRVFVRWTAFGAASLPAAALAGSLQGMKGVVLGIDRRGRADTLAIEQIRETVSLCRRLDDAGMPAVVLQVGRRTLARVGELLDSCTSTAARRPLTLAAGELSQLVGYAAAGLHDVDLATRSTTRALAAADEADSAGLHAYGMSINLAAEQLYERTECDLGAATTAAAAAQEWARLSGNPADISHVESVTARVHARAGREAEAFRALDRARRCLERSAPEERPTWLYWYNGAVIVGHRGQCLLDLQRAGRSPVSSLDETVAAVRAALGACTGGYPRDRANHHMNLADAYWVHGEREESLRHASDALVLAAGLDWRRLRERLEEVRRRTEDDPLAAARDFHERYRTAFSA